MIFHPAYLQYLQFFWLLRPGAYPVNDNHFGNVAA